MQLEVGGDSDDFSSFDFDWSSTSKGSGVVFLALFGLGLARDAFLLHVVKLLVGCTCWNWRTYEKLETNRGMLSHETIRITVGGWNVQLQLVVSSMQTGQDLSLRFSF